MTRLAWSSCSAVVRSKAPSCRKSARDRESRLSCLGKLQIASPLVPPSNRSSAHVHSLLKHLQALPALARRPASDAILLCEGEGPEVHTREASCPDQTV